MKNLEEEIFKYLSEHLSPKRFEHSFAVSKLAVELAAKNGENIYSAQTAGLLHDCAKFMQGKDFLGFFKNRTKPKYFNEIKKYAPELLHGNAAAFIAKEKFAVKNKDILSAIANHTFGRENMSKLEKIIFIADSVSEDRKYKNASKIRALAKKDLDKAFVEVLKHKIYFVINNEKWFCAQTLDTWNFYAAK
ncbi:bis(5'-nucleosyl)-tetraphosphatase (symmetrical) YqeK [Endomicrobium proavitum]|uniref:bis(5'-nucleosyl)-tetraphosphatase (symmetrical) n=1 Tax=Endomicrobium proavitum TaxID=1408281 RepID=A0A0G3WKE9_9BACT|nr:bis(5'-nucleosyl)-tetraphosphatase (symmetrical) YqeK [Endomicrobium proavitum]AKL98380.1 metal dependent phosphohydrolase [Endomicrobium proavitum]